ncbi:Trp biosynthesis-associated membrane protein [Kribbia dieselivorans]|uniref:Trp biosynthesis-associated membrane protein n=1 Tax=Kribbia dieselivorans TaxID=331526 RepID=UPI0008389764|nr:Trp biosynthesis-associated membrane protein [Kribbia dieselivorans]
MSRLSRLTSKGSVVVLAIVAAVVLMAAARQPWVTGTVNEVAASRVEATGSEVATGLVALALAAVASAIVAATSGRIVRLITVVLFWACLAGLVATTVRVIADPTGVLGGIAAVRTGLTGSIETTARLTAWPWVALFGEALFAVAGVATLVGMRRWKALGSRYEVDGQDVAGARGERVSSDWDRLSAGDDPTQD